MKCFRQPMKSRDRRNVPSTFQALIPPVTISKLFHIDLGKPQELPFSFNIGRDLFHKVPGLFINMFITFHAMSELFPKSTAFKGRIRLIQYLMVVSRGLNHVENKRDFKAIYCFRIL